ncbi:HPP family protein [Rhizorhabdus dicambivorans]|uniref:HPP family protein n=1 Tax=Rhizorhabdus dicambivorans TaxID=1850238 RepID=A0A2A4FXS0_9SPHN|nr:HPP family protein [Rhizorhabdus dicambivorans]ATE66927.1 HPP family protein [Rhizorhabdus dicambivorans]PCE42203.1 HPP family protein [Rhizorhabdus dicambivorans]
MVRTEAMSWQQVALAATVFLAALALFGGLAHHFGIIAMWMPLVNSLALVATTPKLPSAHPWPIVAGHAATAVVGSVAGYFFGASVGVAIIAATLGLLLMLVGRAMHPPAAATGLVFTLHPVSPHIAVPLLLLGAAGIAALGAVLRRR